MSGAERVREVKKKRGGKENRMTRSRSIKYHKIIIYVHVVYPTMLFPKEI